MLKLPSRQGHHKSAELGLGSRADIVLIGTLIMLLRYTLKEDGLELLLLASAAGLCSVGVRTSAIFWWCVAGMQSFLCIHEWWTHDNHIFLMNYWCLAVASVLTFGKRNVQPLLAKNSLYLIAFCMLSATLQKASSEDFRDGRFFEYTLLTDSRFEEMTHFATGLSSKELKENRVDVRSYDYCTTGEPIELQTNKKVTLLSKFMTVWTLAIEGLIALVFVFAAFTGKLAKTRSWLLLGFMLTTYPVANVIGFAWMLNILGYSSVPDKFKFTRIAFVVLFFLNAAFDFALLEWFDFGIKSLGWTSCGVLPKS